MCCWLVDVSFVVCLVAEDLIERWCNVPEKKKLKRKKGFMVAIRHARQQSRAPRTLASSPPTDRGCE